jgi:pSer/pThr/pTyr-binding forkhead associated (FHA) protein
MASLLIVSGSSAGDYFLLGRSDVVIGRDDGCPIQIVDDAVSRRHLHIRHEGTGDRYVAEDLNSANGTRVNDESVDQPHVLSDGDILHVGATEIMFCSIDFADRETAFQHYRRRGEGEKSTIIRNLNE